jgi:fatty acid desaturase
MSTETTPATVTVPEARRLARDEGLNDLRPRAALVHLALQVAAVAACTLVAARLEHWYLRLPVWAVLSVLLAGLGGMLHEALHRLLFPRRWANDLAATLVGGAMLFPYGIYQQFHLGHHARFGTDDDPEGKPIRFASRLEYVLSMLVGTPIFLGILWWASAKAILGLSVPSWVRRPDRARRSMLALLAVAAVAAWSAARWWWLLGAGFLPGLAGTYLVVLGVLLLPEHYGAGPDEPISEQTTTTTSTGLLTWAFWGANHHTAHHLVATVPGPSLPRLTELVADGIPAHRWSAGYLRWHLDLVRSLPWLPPRRGGDAVVTAN